jgi:hypothetical protein
MIPRIAVVWSWALVVLLASCKRDDLVRETAAEAEALAEAIVVAVREAEQPTAGVASARALLEGRAAAFDARLAEVRALPSAQVGDRARIELGQRLTRALVRVRALQADLLADTLTDDALRDALDRLVADFENLVLGP